MSCKVARLDICRLIQESFVSPTFNFGDVDISNDTFVYTVKKYLTEKKQVINTVKLDNNTLAIAEHDLKLGKYEHELLWIHGNNKDVVFQGIVEVTNKGNNHCKPTPNVIEVVTENTIVNVAYSENVINVGGGEGSVLLFEVNDNMELEMISSNATEVDFELVDGNLNLIID